VISQLLPMSERKNQTYFPASRRRCGRSLHPFSNGSFPKKSSF
jgi:hypothetical protein